MKELFQAFAAYNRNANKIICDHLTQDGSAALTMETDTYFKTIAGTLYHLMDSNLRWLDRMSAFRNPAVNAAALAEFQLDAAPDARSIAANEQRFYSLAESIDVEIVKLVEAIPSGAFAEDFTMQFGQNKITRLLWQLLFQWFNHHTHHRGQISLLLDLSGIENNFSLVLDKI